MKNVVFRITPQLRSYKSRFQSSVVLKKVVDDHSLCPKMSSTR
jgi:hypothetical protein